MDTTFFVKKPISAQDAVEGTANALIDGQLPFTGKVTGFWSDGAKITVWASQESSPTMSRELICKFDARIANGKHLFVANGPVQYLQLLVKNGPQMTPYLAVHGSGYFYVTFSLANGTLDLTFDLSVKNPTGPELKANGAYKNVSGLEHPPT